MKPLTLKKSFLICWWYESDLWGDIIVWHKWVNWTSIWIWPMKPLTSNVTMSKTKLFISKMKKESGFLNFSFNIYRKMKWWNWMRIWMWLFFLSKMLWFFYGDISWISFRHLCAVSLSKWYWVFFYFLKIFEFWIPMILYWNGLASSIWCAEQWVLDGNIIVNNQICTNMWVPLRIYDFIAFQPTLWSELTINFISVFFLAWNALWWWKCSSMKVKLFWSMKWAHFIFTLDFLYFDYKMFSLYWYKSMNPYNLKYYFKAKFLNIAKYMTI